MIKGVKSITTKYINGFKEFVREEVASNGDGENRTGFLFLKELLLDREVKIDDN